MHDMPNAGHLGFHHTLGRMHKRYFWPGMSKDIREYVESCPQCQARNTNPQQRVRAPAILETIPSLFERVAVDVQGEFKESAKHNKYIVTFICLSSRWIEAFAISNCKSSTIAKLFVSQILLRYGPVRSLLSDRGSYFLSKLTRHVLKIFNVTKLDIAAYHPESNAKVERVHRLYNDMISKYVNDQHNDWDEWLPFVQHAYRTSRHSATSFSPYELVFGRTCEDFVDTSLFPESPAPACVSTWFRALKRRAAEYRKLGKQMELASIEESLAQAPKKDPIIFAIGERVMLRNMAKPPPNTIKKYLKKWLSGYIIRGRAGPTRYEVVRVDDQSRNPTVYVRDVNDIKRESERDLPPPEDLSFSDLPVNNPPAKLPKHQPTLDSFEKILDRKEWDRPGGKDIEYLVHHTHTDSRFNLWYPREDIVEKFPDAVESFDAEHELERLRSKRKTYTDEEPRRSSRNTRKQRFGYD